MAITIHVLGSRQATVSDTLPEEFRGNWLPGSTISSAKGDIGVVTAQTVTIESLSMYYLMASAMLDIRLQVTGTVPLCVIWIQVEGLLEVDSETIKYTFSRQDYYSFLLLNRFPVDIKLPKQVKYAAVAFAYPVPYIRSLLLHYPLLTELEDNLTSQRNIVYKEQMATVSVLEKVYGILHTPYVPLMKEYYLRTFKEIVQALLEDYSADSKGVIHFDMHDIGYIHAAKEYIDTHLSEHHTIAQIARAVGTNQLKLKKGFKAIYGIGVYGYLLKQRLQIAKTALEKTTKPVHQIARQAGYKSTPNFSVAFRRTFGVSPYKYRQQMRNQ